MAITNKDLFLLQEKMDKKLNDLSEKIDTKYVSRNEIELRFKPVEEDLSRFKNLLYGTIASLIGLVVAGLAGGNLI